MTYFVLGVLVVVIGFLAGFTLLLQRAHETDRGEWRSERERLLRAALARNTGEFATLERIHNAEVAAAHPPSPEDFTTRERELLERMGMNGEQVPRVPEGL
jgi:hypothetical protein